MSNLYQALRDSFAKDQMRSDAILAMKRSGALMEMAQLIRDANLQLAAQITHSDIPKDLIHAMVHNNSNIRMLSSLLDVASSLEPETRLAQDNEPTSNQRSFSYE